MATLPQSRFRPNSVVEGPDLRPTFRVPLEYPRDVAIERIRERLVARPELHGRWQGKGRWAEIDVPTDRRKIWSPHLSLRVDKAKEGSELFGRFAPRPQVWTFFMFVYGAVAFLAILGAVLGYAQQDNRELGSTREASELWRATRREGGA